MDTTAIAPINQNEIASLIESMNKELERVHEAVHHVSVNDYSVTMMNDEDFKQCKTWLSTAIRDAKATKTKFRKEWQKPMNDIGSLFDAELEFANDLMEIYKNESDRREAEKREDHIAQMEQVYLEFCEANGLSALAQNVPFERLLERDWLNGGKAWNIRKKGALVEEKATRILNDLTILESSNVADLDSAKRDFFDTLDLAKTLELDRERAQKQERLEQLKAEQEQNARYMQEQEETDTETPAEDQAQIKTAEIDEDEPAPRFEYSLTFTATEQDFQLLLTFMRGHNITGNYKKLTSKENNNG